MAIRVSVASPAVCRTSARWAFLLSRGGRKDRRAQRFPHPYDRGNAQVPLSTVNLLPEITRKQQHEPNFSVAEEREGYSLAIPKRTDYTAETTTFPRIAPP